MDPSTHTLRQPLLASVLMGAALVAAPGLCAAPNQQPARIERYPVEGKCFGIVRDGAGIPHPVRLRGLQVLLDPTTVPRQILGLSPPKPPGTVGYACLREQLVHVSSGDSLLVAEAGLALDVVSADGRIGALTDTGAPVPPGHLTAEELQHLIPEMKQSSESSAAAEAADLGRRMVQLRSPACLTDHRKRAGRVAP